MSILILLASFTSLFLIIGVVSSFTLKDILLKTMLTFSVILLLITEVLSAFHLLNFQFVSISWMAISVLSIIYLFLKKERVFNFAKRIKQYCTGAIQGLTKFELLLLTGAAIILLLIFIQVIAYPPNNWDSMTYHLARVTNWISHGSVAHYPTHIFRQLYQPPFAEFVILHFNMLSGGDYFSNAVQFIFLIFSIVAIVSIVEIFGLSRKYKIIALVLVVTIPEVVLQTSSTQNDIVVSFFILTAIYFAAKSIKEASLQNYLFLGLSIGFAVLTKGTAYIYLAPILLLFAMIVLIQVFRTKHYAHLDFGILAVLVFLSLNAGHFIRNYTFNNSILGVDEAEHKMYTNEYMTPALLLSNIIKNAGLHLGPAPVNKVATNAIYKLHSIAGIDINTPVTNYRNLPYEGAPDRANHEDNAPNLIHFLLLSFALVVTGFTIRDKKQWQCGVTLYLAVIVLQILLFCMYVKWQPWHSRLHTPLFLLSVPVICYALSLRNKYLSLTYKAIPVLFIPAFLIINRNYLRPLWTNKYADRISVTDARYKKYFAAKPDAYRQYNTAVQTITEMNYKHIGLMLGVDDWEYPLFSRFYNKGVHPVHINVTNITKSIAADQKIIHCIVSTNLNTPSINFQGKVYYNSTPGNTVIWLYK